MMTTGSPPQAAATANRAGRLSLLSSGTPQLADDATTQRKAASAQLTLAAIFAASLLSLAAGYALSSDGLRLLGAAGSLLAGIGGAPLALSQRLGMVERAALALMIGVGVATIVGAVMVFVPLWQPIPVAVLLGAAAVAAHLVGVGRSISELSERRPSLRRPRVTPLERASPVFSAVGAALWIGAAAVYRDHSPATWGFLTHISPLWFVGVALLIFAIVFARGQHEAFVAVPVILIAAALTVTPALVYGEPRSQTAIKHVLLVQQILAHPHLHASSYIYYAYSGFFSAMAWLLRIADVGNPLAAATFWPAIVALGAAIELRFLFGRMFSSPYRCWAGVAIAILADAVGQDYFSPQSVGYVLVIGVYGLALAGRPLRLSPRSRIGLLVLAGCTLAVMHELSPYIAGGSLLVLALFDAVTPRWAALTSLLPAGLWAALNAHALAGFFSISALGNLSNFAPPSTGTQFGLPRAATISESSDSLTLGLLVLIALALTGLARNRRVRGAWGLVIAAGVGLVFLAINPYGNEGIFRAALFGIPWLALLALGAIGDVRRFHFGLGAVLAAMFATFCVAEFSIDGFAVVRAGDLGALHAFLARAAPDAYRVTFGGSGDLPTTVSPTLHYINWTPLTDRRARARGTPTALDMRLVTISYDNYAATIGHTAPANVFVTWSPTAAEYARNYGLETPANSRAWLRLLQNSPLWRVVYSSAGSYLFRRTANPA